MGRGRVLTFCPGTDSGPGRKSKFLAGTDPGRGQKFKKLAGTDPGRGRKLNFWPGQNTGPGHSARPVSLHWLKNDPYPLRNLWFPFGKDFFERFLV